MAVVTVIAGKERIDVPDITSGSPPVVPAQNLLIEIQSDTPVSKALLNDDTFDLVRGPSSTSSYLVLDYFRSSGFHRLTVAGRTYCFGTADAKLELDGIFKILHFIKEEGLSWGHQLIFSDGASIRDHRVDFAWLRRVGQGLIDSCSQIAEQPMSSAQFASRISRPRGDSVNVSKTMALLRKNPHEYLEEYRHGILHAHGKRWMPRKVVIQKREALFDTIANRRVTRLLLDVCALAREIIAAGELPRERNRWLTNFEKEVAILLDCWPFNMLVRSADRAAESESVRELADARYNYVIGLHDEFLNRISWNPSQHVTDSYSYVGYSDEIYQAFVAVVLGEVFGAGKVRFHLLPDQPGPSFKSAQWSLYYDTKPPPAHYPSWRDNSSRPADLTPDYCLIDVTAGRGFLGDAKYRARGRGRTLPSTALNDCQVYMQHFGLNTFAVFYPGPDKSMQKIEGDGNVILQVSITPCEGLLAWIASEVRPELESLLRPFNNSDSH